MLVVCRKPGEQFVIGNSAKVTVRRVQGDRVWLGLDAARSNPIDRQELRRQKPELEVLADVNPSIGDAARRSSNAET